MIWEFGLEFNSDLVEVAVFWAWTTDWPSDLRVQGFSDRDLAALLLDMDSVSDASSTSLSMTIIVLEFDFNLSQVEPAPNRSSMGYGPY